MKTPITSMWCWILSSNHITWEAVPVPNNLPKINLPLPHAVYIVSRIKLRNCGMECLPILKKLPLYIIWNHFHRNGLDPNATVALVSYVRYTMNRYFFFISWWRHQMGTFSALLALCTRNSPVTDEFPAKARDAELWCFLWSAPEWTVE